MAIFSTGAIFEEIRETEEILASSGIHPAVYTFPTVKPIDVAVIQEVAQRFDLIVTVEEHNLNGGFGSAVAEVLTSFTHPAQQLMVGLDNLYSVKVGSQKYLRAEYGLDGNSIADRILRALVL